MSILAAWDRPHHRSEGLRFILWVLCPPGNLFNADGKDITDLKLILNGDSNVQKEVDTLKS